MRTIRNASVAVVGGAGFLGSHLVNHLIEDRGCKVRVVDNLSVGLTKYIHPKASFSAVDVCIGDHDFLADLIKGSEWLFMVAAIPFVPDGFKRPLHTFENTATSVLKVLCAAEKAGVEGTLVVSSAEIFGSTVGGAVSESSPIVPHSTYAAAKQAADSLVQVRWHEAGVRSLAVRQFNSYGPRCLQPLVLTTIISQLANGPVVQLGNNTTRDFQFCADTVKAWTLLLENGQWGDVINCGSETCITIYDLAEMVGRIMGYDKIEIVLDESRVRPGKVEVWHLHADCTKMHSVIGRQQTIALEDGLAQTIAWYRKNGGWDFARE